MRFGNFSYIKPQNQSIMKTSTSNHGFFKLVCDAFGHNYKMTKTVTAHVKEYTCTCCKHQLTTNSNGKLTELTPKYKDINSVLETLYHRKTLRLKKKELHSSIY